MTDINPYASPVVIDEAPSVTPTTANRPYAERFLWALGRWTIICGISAAPSFWIWYATGNSDFVNVSAMLSGIAVFVVSYAFLECSRWYEKARQIPNARTALYVGYISRMVLSLIFPVAMMIDMFFGIVAVGIVEGLGGKLHNDLSDAGKATWVFVDVFATTVIEGILLNIALVGYMGVVFGLLCAVRRK